MIQTDSKVKFGFNPNTLLTYMGFLSSLKDSIADTLSEFTSDDCSDARTSRQAAVPPPPPAPAGGIPSPHDESSVEDSPLSPRLTRLIDAAVADGEITDMERGVLVRNARKEGVDMDEFVMVLEARLYEKRQELLARRAAAKPAAVPPPPPVATSAPQAPIVQRQVAQKCPACGAYIDPTTTRCPECRINYSALTNCGTAAERLDRIMCEIERERPADTSFFRSFLSNQMALMGGDAITNRKSTAIANFPVPSNKQDIFDLFASCAAKSKHDAMQYTGEEYILCGAYKRKAKEILIKARIIMADEPEVLARLERVAKQNKIKA